MHPVPEKEKGKTEERGETKERESKRADVQRARRRPTVRFEPNTATGRD